MINEKDMEIEIDLLRCLRAVVKRWWFICIFAIIGGVIGVALTLSPGYDIYGAKSTVYSAAFSSYKDSQVGTSAMNDYADIATSMKVCNRAALLLGNANVTGADIKNITYVVANKSGNINADSAILTITSTYTDPLTAMEISQAVAEAFCLEMSNILGTDNVQILDKAYDYYVVSDATKHMWKIRLISVAACAFIAIVIIVLSVIFGRKAMSIRECSLGETLPIIGVIPEYKD